MAFVFRHPENHPGPETARQLEADILARSSWPPRTGRTTPAMMIVETWYRRAQQLQTINLVHPRSHCLVKLFVQEGFANRNDPRRNPFRDPYTISLVEYGDLTDISTPTGVLCRLVNTPDLLAALNGIYAVGFREVTRDTVLREARDD